MGKEDWRAAVHRIGHDWATEINWKIKKKKKLKKTEK